MTNHAMAAAPSRSGNSYDSVTITLHWLTAVLVICLFVSIELRGFLPRGTWIRSEMQPVHVSLGILPLPTMLLRCFWRLSRRGNLPPTTSGHMDIAARLAHFGLYGLLIAQVVLGFALSAAREGPSCLSDCSRCHG
ncbi:cytochrome b/b6 domain-containing protein [Rhizobium sp. 007]|uniref:cytochrome b n=1 Tax=Rhizobium sp. 007 TaxID=2785056 RepID=UPI001890545A|nr:cytochrome b/b6 domain-containing protein [Rhizobium sp. 007]QPB18467.1 cytochrome b/b6 domain-containing protein [Rhizobium sp. 007]